MQFTLKQWISFLRADQIKLSVFPTMLFQRLYYNDKFAIFSFDFPLRYGGQYNGFFSVIKMTDGSYMMLGWMYNGSYKHFWLLKTAGEHGLAWGSSTSNSSTLYKSPTDPARNLVRNRIFGAYSP